MNFGSFKNVKQKLFVYKLYKQDFAWYNLQELMP